MHRLAQSIFAVALVSVCRSVSHCFLWERNLRRAPPADLSQRKQLQKWMRLELLVAVAGAALGYWAQATDLAFVSCGPVPLLLILLFLFAAGTVWTVVEAADAAEAADLSPVSNSLRDYLENRGATGKLSRFAGFPLWKDLYEWLKARLAPNQASGLAALVITVPIILLGEGAVAVADLRIEQAVERPIIEWIEEEPQAEAQEPETSDPPPDRARARPGECSFEPGSPAPEPWSEELYAVWYGGEEIEGAGNVAAGCPQPAEVESGQPRVWVERGICDGRLEGLGVAAPDYGPPAMLLQQAAAIGAGFAAEGRLLGASPRTRVGEGDLYAFETPTGTYIAVRSRRTYGPTGRSSPATECGRFDDRNVAYQVAPPGLLGTWMTIASQGWVWPVARGGGRFVFLTPGGKQVGEATCVTDLSCEGSFLGQPLGPIDEPVVSAETLAAIASG